VASRHNLNLAQLFPSTQHQEFWRPGVLLNSHLESEALEWYIFESVAGLSVGAERTLRLGPFATDNECRSVLESIQQIPRFSRSTLEVHTRRRRRDKRIRVELPVHLCRSAAGNVYQPARTVDISKSGARLAGFPEQVEIGEVIEIRYGNREAPFQVIWAGAPYTAGQGEFGVECLTPEANIWQLDLSRQTDEDPVPKEIAVASAVQSRLLPQELVHLRTLDYSGHCSQARTVGGDYYDFIDMGSGSVGLVLADVAGKGIAAALLMANLQGSLRSQVSIHSRDLPQVLASVNCHFYKHTDLHRYATLFFACYDDATQALRYVNCGHNPPLLLHQGSVERLTATATVLGLFRNWECSVAEARMQAGDILCIYTDGITEATGENGKEFGEPRLLQVLHENHHLEAASIVHKVEQAVEQFRSGEQEDDLTMVIARAR